MAEVNVRIVGFKRIDYDKKIVRKALRTEAAPIRNIAKVLVGRRETSKAGEYPGLVSGKLRRSIGIVGLKGQLAFVVEPRRAVLNKSGGAKNGAYPWMLVNGIRRGKAPGRLAAGEGIGKNNRRGRGQLKALREARRLNGWRVAPRADPLIEALTRRTAAATQAIHLAMQGALVPRA